MNTKSVFQRLILFSVDGYLDDISNETTYNYAFVLRIRTSIRSYILFHKFNKEEDSLLKELAETTAMKNMSNMQIDRVMFAIELLYLYITQIDKKDRAHLNISDDKIKKLKSTLVMDMLKLKHRSDSYDNVKEIVDDSRVGAKHYFYFIKEWMNENTKS